MPDKITVKNKKKELLRLLQFQKEELEHYRHEKELALSLERVQEKALAMHNSSDISETTAIFFYELNRLGIEMERCGIVIFNDTPIMEVWSTPLSPKNNQLHEIVTGKLDSRIHPMLQGVYSSWEKGKEYFSYTLKGDEIREYYEKLKQVPEYQFPENKNYPEIQIDNCFYFNEGHLFVYTKSPLSEDVKDIFHRFTRVFSLAYTRYLDLKKAEEQAREAQIEAALERVRAKAMAMHSSKDISGATAIVFNEFTRLGIKMIRAGIVIHNESTPISEVWSTQLSSSDEEGVQIVTGNINMNIHPMLQNSYQDWKKKNDYFSYELKGDEIKKYYELLEKEPGYHFPKVVNYPKRQILNAFGFSEGGIFVYSADDLPQHTKQIIHRFSKVFSLTYKRYLDIVKAEAQARDAQIEASLERVRAKAMSMRSSKDISGATAIVFNELTRLGVEIERCGIGIFNDTPIMEIWSTPLSQKNKQVVKVITGKIKSDIHPMIQGSYQAWKNKNDFFTYELKGVEVEKYYELLEKDPGYNFPKITNLPNQQILNSFSFDEGAIFVYTKNKLPEASRKIIQRFSKVFSLTYKRYIDIINAEKQAREAIKQASLNRVRGEIASMRNSEDLNRITPIIWRELKELKVPFIRCGVFIIDEENEKTKAYLSTPAGEALAVLNLKIDQTSLTKKLVDYWKKNQVYQEHWSKTDFIKWMKSMMKSGQVQSAEKYQGAPDAPESLYLHFIPFKQGMLYVGNSSPHSKKELDLINSLAKSFSIAYARYEDFINLENAKLQIEKTLEELKAAQTLLIHSEKMASLGELTAGIAHEIQNPLNFVNNFSELSNELLQELKEEMQNGNKEEVKALAEDVILNLQKINLHGKRAESIIKGMLLHSRGSSGHKESTNLNSLCDEYLRLSYHGFRAKDKSFNADYNLEADPSLPKVEVIPQDIGRVLLNLINNAFYVVSERQKTLTEFKSPSGLNYKPAVTVATKNLGDRIEITVRDNGPGIPEKIKEKIFQPFFTTKPTGQGTGLGLSLSYDIVKAHGGELRVDTQEETGSVFIIQIPVV